MEKDIILFEPQHDPALLIDAGEYAYEQGKAAAATEAKLEQQEGTSSDPAAETGSRIAQEKWRQQNETARISSEEARKVAEGSDDSTSQYYESGRCFNERKRQNAETARSTAETARNTAETARNAAEAKREAFEKGGTYTDETGTHTITYANSRQGMEASRAAAESQRETTVTTEVGKVETALTNIERVKKNMGDAFNVYQNEADKMIARAKVAENIGSYTAKQAEWCEAKTNEAIVATNAAEKVNATLSGSTLIVTDRNGVSMSVETKGAKGDPGSDAEVTKANIESALGYTPADKSKLGDTTTLNTTDKTSAVKAINEVNTNLVQLGVSSGTMITQLQYDLGDKSQLTTDANNNLVAAINEVDGKTDEFQTELAGKADAEDLEDSERILTEEDIAENGNGKIISNSGTVATQANYCYTKPITLKKGDSVSFEATAGLTWLYLLSTDRAYANRYAPLIVGQSSYTGDFVAPCDIVVYVSCKKSSIGSVTIKKAGTLTKVADHEERIASIEDSIGSHSVSLSSIDTEGIVASSMRGYDGIARTQTGYFYTQPIKVNKGSFVRSTTSYASTASIAQVTKVDKNGTNLGAIKVGSATSETLAVEITENCYISICEKNDNFGYVYIDHADISSVVEEIEKNTTPDSVLRIDSIEDDNPLKVIRRDAGFGAIIKSWGFIGDSYSSGETPTIVDGVMKYGDFDCYNVSWGQQLMRIIGAEGYNFSNGGQTTYGWNNNVDAPVYDNTHFGGAGGGAWTLAQQSANIKQAYIISLGINDRKKIANGVYPLGNADTDIAEAYAGNANSFVGHYAGIIQRIKSVQSKAKIFCVTQFGDDCDSINGAIRSVVSKFSNVYLMDFRAYGKNVNSVQYMNANGHPTPAGYMYMAYMANTYIDWIIRENLADFTDVTSIDSVSRVEAASTDKVSKAYVDSKVGEISTEITTLQTAQGNLSDLTTTAKNNLVAAINEAAQSGGGGGAAETWRLINHLTFTEEATAVTINKDTNNNNFSLKKAALYLYYPKYTGSLSPSTNIGLRVNGGRTAQAISAVKNCNTGNSVTAKWYYEIGNAGCIHETWAYAIYTGLYNFNYSTAKNDSECLTTPASQDIRFPLSSVEMSNIIVFEGCEIFLYGVDA